MFEEFVGKKVKCVHADSELSKPIWLVGILAKEYDGFLFFVDVEGWRRVTVSVKDVKRIEEVRGE